MLTYDSCTASGPKRGSGRSQQRYPRLSRRFVFCRTPRCAPLCLLPLDAGISSCKYPRGSLYLLTLADFTKPFLIRLFFKPTWENFVGAVTLCGYASFLFGWHVHEKAILIVIIPFSLIALRDRRYLGAFRPLAVAGHVSLFPLLFTAAEFPIKTVYTIFWLVLFLMAFDRLVPAYVYILLHERSRLHSTGRPTLEYGSSTAFPCSTLRCRYR